MQSKWANKRLISSGFVVLALCLEGMATLPFLQSLLVGVCLLAEQRETLKAFPSPWSSDCNGNSRHGMKCHCGSLMTKDSIPETERQTGSLAVTTWLILPLLSRPRQWLTDLWKRLEVLWVRKALYSCLRQTLRGTKNPFHVQISLLDSFLHSIPS